MGKYTKNVTKNSKKNIPFFMFDLLKGRTFFGDYWMDGVRGISRHGAFFGIGMYKNDKDELNLITGGAGGEYRRWCYISENGETKNCKQHI